MSITDKIGKYKLLGVLGQGGMGVVYKALDPSIGREVAIKTIHKHLLTSSTGADKIVRFTREAQAAGRFLHRNIVTIFEYGEHEGTPYLVMEYVEGKELKDVLTERVQLPVVEAVDIFSQVCSGLEHAHSKGIVHRDLKPANIFMLADGTAKIADFGIARIQDAEITGEGEILGTPYYMSPEQLMAKKIDARSDLFSLAIVLYESLTGQKPFAGDSIPQIMLQILQDNPKLPTAICPSIPASFNGLLSQALEKDPDRRYQTAGDFLKALKEAARGNSAARPVASDFGQAAAASAGGFDADTLKQIETTFTKFLGPIAKVMLKRKAASATSISNLLDTLAAEIPKDSERSRFMAETAALKKTADRAKAPTDDRLISSGTITGAISGTGVPGFDAEFLKKLEAALTTYLGPMAKLIVKKSASLSGNKEDLCHNLSQEISNPDDRKKFLNQVLTDG